MQPVDCYYMDLPALSIGGLLALANQIQTDLRENPQDHVVQCSTRNACGWIVLQHKEGWRVRIEGQDDRLGNRRYALSNLAFETPAVSFPITAPDNKDTQEALSRIYQAALLHSLRCVEQVAGGLTETINNLNRA